MTYARTLLVATQLPQNIEKEMADQFNLVQSGSEFLVGQIARQTAYNNCSGIIYDSGMHCSWKELLKQHLQDTKHYFGETMELIPYYADENICGTPQKIW